MDREDWYAAVHGVAKSQTGPSDWIELKHYKTVMKETEENINGKIFHAFELGEFILLKCPFWSLPGFLAFPNQ